VFATPLPPSSSPWHPALPSPNQLRPSRSRRRSAELVKTPEQFNGKMVQFGLNTFPSFSGRVC